MRMSIAPQTHWTVAMLNERPDDGNRCEIIDGELFVTPAPTFRHQDAVLCLYRLLFEYVETIGRFMLVAPADVPFSENTQVQPDLFVLPRQLGGKRPVAFGDVGVLTLAVEVLSPGTTRVDRERKRDLFRRQRVPEYWVVDVDGRAIERYRPEAPEVERLTRMLDWHPHHATPALTIDLDDYFRRVRDE